MGVRLSVVDEIFLWTHSGLGLPIVMQGVWRTDSAVDPRELEQLCVRVASGPLGRRVRRPRIPGARPEFVADPRHYPPSFRSDPVAADDVVEWADAAALISVDPERGPGWRIAATYDSSGGTVVSVTCSHVLADARGLIGALRDAMQHKPSPPSDHTGRSDISDALSTVGRVLRGTSRAVGGLIVSPARRAELRGFTTPAAVPRRSARERATTAILEVDRGQWDAAAASSGGTPNSLFLACVGELARAENKTAPVTLSVPMNVRTTDRNDNSVDNDHSVDNSVAMVAIPLAPSTSLAQIRRLCRDAFEAPPMSSPAGFPAELLQVVPDRLAHRLADGPGQRDALCSNIGTVDIDQFEGHRTSGLALRAVHPGASAAQLDSTSTRVSGYLSRNNATYTLSLVSFESADNQSLRTSACNTLEEFGISARPW
ncbi:hypothetical protein ACFRFQ_24380 [Rhodococcus sp. NPDC056743]|uniref:hypothetical protein n=1 Tax=Rhodococcus sp. NPDC056743 TaxID=3345934 RepID=UPI00366F5556